MRIFYRTRLARRSLTRSQTIRQLGERDALCSYVQRVERLAGCHEEVVTFRSSEAEIGAGLRQMNFADQFAIGRNDMDTVVTFPGPSSAGPDVAIHVASDAVE